MTSVYVYSSHSSLSLRQPLKPLAPTSKHHSLQLQLEMEFGAQQSPATMHCANFKVNCSGPQEILTLQLLADKT